MKPAHITCNTNDRVGAIHPFIYGHFIEHLAECIYGGLWAEMLQNRKFAGNDQPPKGRVTAEQYGIVYPWYAVNRTPQVRYTHDNTVYYNGLQSQRIDLQQADGQPHGIAQGNIALQKGRTYDVRLVLSQSGMAGPLRVSLGKGGRTYAEHVIPAVAPQWRSETFSLVASEDDPEAEFAITFDHPGQVWIGAASLMPSDNVQGWRRDVLELTREMRPPVLRYPGGNFVSGYHWQDGIGDRDQRPIRYDYAWNVWEPNDVGIDEFMQLCTLLGCEPYISVNAGNGTAEEAAAWVEYCNGATNTRYGSLRAQNGHPDPYAIRYWGIGNEMYGNWQIGHCDAETFGRRHLAFAAAMRAVDPTIILLGVGDMPDAAGKWLETVTEIAGTQIDLMTVHHYTGVPSELDEAAQAALAVSCPEHIATLLAETRRILDERGPQGHPIAISFDEWNITYRTGTRRQNYALRDGLYAAGIFHIMQRQCTSVTMANIAQMVNLLGVIETSPTTSYGTPIFHAFKLYRDHTGDVALQTEVQSDTFDVPATGNNIPALQGVAYLSAAASLDTRRNLLCLAVINRHPSQSIPAYIELAGAARNTPDNKDNVTIHARGTIQGGSSLGYAFAAHSVTVLELALQ
jgi:alpha-N-arabinofuranosidase